MRRMLAALLMMTQFLAGTKRTMLLSHSEMCPLSMFTVLRAYSLCLHAVKDGRGRLIAYLQYTTEIAVVKFIERQLSDPVVR